MAIMGRPIIWNDETVARETEALWVYIKNTSLPTLQGFAGERGYSVQRLCEWRKSADFSEAIREELIEVCEMCKDKFLHAVMLGGLSKQLHPGIVALCLKNVGGWDISTGATQQVSVNAVQQIAAAQQSRDDILNDMDEKGLDEIIAGRTSSRIIEVDAHSS